MSAMGIPEPDRSTLKSVMPFLGMLQDLTLKKTLGVHYQQALKLCECNLDISLLYPSSPSIQKMSVPSH